MEEAKWDTWENYIVRCEQKLYIICPFVVVVVVVVVRNWDGAIKSLFIIIISMTIGKKYEMTMVMTMCTKPNWASLPQFHRWECLAALLHRTKCGSRKMVFADIFQVHREHQFVNCAEMMMMTILSIKNAIWIFCRYKAIFHLSNGSKYQTVLVDGERGRTVVRWTEFLH